MTEVPKFVLRRLAGTAAPTEHPPADLLAAFGEQQLAGAERENLLAHLAACDSCREAVWHSLPEEEASQAAAGAVRRKLWVPAWRWAGVAAAVAVIAVVALVYRGGPGPAGNQVAWVAPATSAAPAPAAPAPANQAAQVATRDEPRKDSNVFRKPSPEAGGRGSLLKAQAKTADALQAASGPVPASANEADVTIASAGNIPAMGKKKLAPPTLWMLSPEGQLLRSTDSGKNWQAVPFEGKVVFRAVAVVGPRVWVGGVGGTLYYSSDDGSQWTRLAPSDNIRLNDDVRALIFQDSRHGNLTTAGGQSWATSDGGHSWRKQ